MKHPYESLPTKAFWKTSVGSRSLFDINELWTPKLSITEETAVATYGSCFAQHIGRNLKKRGCNWLITESPSHKIEESLALKFGYNTFSSRTANIYTSSLLLQWISWASNAVNVPEIYWEKSGRFYDPFRPAIEPNGFSSISELIGLRQHTIECFNKSIKEADVFVFTMGLTESWFDSEGFEYPMCPGTIAGEFDPSKHFFKNQNYEFIEEKLLQAISKIRDINPEIQILLTVSPVPLTATNSGKHVLVATMESKSILRAVAGELTNRLDYVDYFPSYEIINSPAFQGVFFEPNKRSVNPRGVDFVMEAFFGAQQLEVKEDNSVKGEEDDEVSDEGCEEAMLEVYGK